jgi:hypothetical protein
MIDILPPLGKYKYDTQKIHLRNCYIDNFVRLRSCIGKSTSVEIIPKQEAPVAHEVILANAEPELP